MEIAQNGNDHEDFHKMSIFEKTSERNIVQEVSSGKVVIVPNWSDGDPVALGEKVRSKVLCNLGTSSKSPDINIEIKKAQLAVESGASIICDQSVGDNVWENRKRLLDQVNVPIAAVPLYQNVDEAKSAHKDPLAFSEDEVLEVFERQVENGVAMPGFHSMSFEIIDQLEKSDRLMPIVSRGGGILHEWIKRHSKQNPYLKQFDRVLEVARDHNVPITFVSSLRSGTVIDGLDKLQEYEWTMIGEYIKEAHSKKVSVIVDGLGHITIDKIPPAVNKFKELCYGVPLGVLGPAVTDRGLGHEHIVNAIGTSVAVWSGANYCNACYRTEHLGLPEIKDIAEGIGAAVIATYSGDLAREEKNGLLLVEERKMSSARKKNQWGIMLHNALDNKEAMKTFKRVGKKNVDGKGCSICGDLCPFVITGQAKK